jgi:transcriptional regulator with XRE-family HTH domain
MFLGLAVKGGGVVVPRRSVRIDPAFGERLRLVMARQKIRPGQLAAALGVTSQSVSRWRRGECPDDLRLPQIADYIRVGLEWLKTGVGTLEPTVQTPGGPAAQRAPTGGRRKEDVELRTARRSVLALQQQATIARLRVLELHKAGEITPELAEAWLSEIQRFLSAGDAHEDLRP